MIQRPPAVVLTAALAFALAAAALGACGSSGATAAPGGDAGDASAVGSDASAPPPADASSPPADASATSRDDGGATDGGSASEASPGEAGPLVLPQVQNYDGGTMATPRLVAVTFANDPEAAQIAAFTKAIGATDYWKAVTSEYGVGAAVGATIAETEQAPASVDQNAGDSETWLSTRFDGTHPEWGTFDPNAVYLLFYPQTTTTTPNVGGCGESYHDAMTVSLPPKVDGGAATKGNMIYGIVFACAKSIDVGRPVGFDLTTMAASHEMIEAVTDPFGSAYAQTDDDHVAWAYFFGSEVGDMCAFHPTAAIKPAELGFTVQRTWSNAAAARLEDPCVPGESTPFFAAAAYGEVPITLDDSMGGTYTSRGFQVPAGQSLTVPVRLYGSAAGAWTVTPFTYTMQHGLADPYLTLSLDKTSGQSGDTLELTITRIKANGTGFGGDGVKLISTLGNVSNEWYFSVSN